MCWRLVGYGAIVMKGGNIGENSVIDMNSITYNALANVVADGSPTIIIKQ